jgi:hypothetical protein
MASLALGVRFTANASGTGDFVTSGAVQGYRDASVLTDTKIYRYRAESADLSQWEYGYGAWSAGSSTLARTTVSFSSTGSKVSFSAAPQVSIVPFVEDILAFDDAMSLTAAQKAQGRQNAYAAPFDALAQNGMQINGAMIVDQEHAGALVAAATSYVVDGWIVTKSGTVVVAGQQVSDAPPNFTNSLKVTVTTAEASLGASDYAVIVQQLEGYRVARLSFGNANALPVSIGFWVKAHRAGTYSGSTRNGANNRAYPFNFTINASDTWEYKTVTIPGDTTGTWLATTGIGLSICFAVATGSSLTGTANTWVASNLLGVTGTTNGVAATSDVFQLTGVTVLPGTEVPSSDRSALIVRPYDVELQLARRYYEQVGVTISLNGGNLENSSWYRASKRVSPTITLVSGSSGGSTVTTMALTPLEGLRQISAASSNFDALYAADARM